MNPKEQESRERPKRELTEWETKCAFHWHEWQCAKHKCRQLEYEIQE
jgi:hypothetical protein